MKNHKQLTESDELSVKEFDRLIKRGPEDEDGRTWCFYTKKGKLISFEAAQQEKEYCRYAIHSGVDNGWDLSRSMIVRADNSKCSKTGKLIIKPKKKEHFDNPMGF